MEEADKASAHRTSVRFSRSNGQNRCMAATTLPSVTGMGHYAVRCDIPICFHLKDSMALAKSAVRDESDITPRLAFSSAAPAMTVRRSSKWLVPDRSQPEVVRAGDQVDG